MSPIKSQKTQKGIFMEETGVVRWKNPENEVNIYILLTPFLN